MTLTLVLPENYEFVALAGVASAFLTFWQGSQVGRARRKAGVKYPQMYAEKAEMAASKDAVVFNNLQRAHQNTLEIYPQFLMTLFLTGLKYPTLAAAAGASWVVGRVFFTFNYRQAAEKRNKGLGFFAPFSGYSEFQFTSWRLWI